MAALTGRIRAAYTLLSMLAAARPEAAALHARIIYDGGLSSTLQVGRCWGWGGGAGIGDSLESISTRHRSSH